jgi:hypothetical protein
MIVWDIQWLKTEPSLCLFVWLFQLFIAWQQIVPNLRPSWFTHTAELLVVLTFSLQAWSPGSSVLSNTPCCWLLYLFMTVLLTVSLSLATVPLHDCSSDCVSVVGYCTASWLFFWLCLCRWLLYLFMTVLLTVSLSLATVLLHDYSSDCVSLVGYCTASWLFFWLCLSRWLLYRVMTILLTVSVVKQPFWEAGAQTRTWRVTRTSVCGAWPDCRRRARGRAKANRPVVSQLVLWKLSPSSTSMEGLCSPPW